MKKLILLLSLVLTTGFAFSQGVTSVGSSQLNVGLGFSNTGVPFYVGFDHRVLRDVSLGAEVSVRAYNEKWDNRHYNHNVFGISGNANYHFNRLFEMPPRWDLYAGANLGFYFWSSPDGYNGNNSSGLGLSGQIGTRYFFNDNFGVNLEFGGGNAFNGGKLGITFML